MIFAVLIAAPGLSSPPMPWPGVCLPPALSSSFQLPFLARIHMLPVPAVDWKHPGVKRFSL